MSKVLVLFEGNWADEMDIFGFKVMDKESWDRYVNYLPDRNFTEYIGSNEDMEFDGKDDYLSNITVKELTDDEASVLLKFFPNSFGQFVQPDTEDNGDDK